MAFGFPPRRTATIPFGDLSEPEFLMLTWETFLYLGWERQHLARQSCSAFVIRGSALAEEVIVKLENGIACISSKTCNQRFADGGRNKNNLENFATDLELVKPGLSKELLAERFEELEKTWMVGGEPVAPVDMHDGSKGFFSFFIPRKFYTATPVLVILNLIVFIAMVASGISFMQPETEQIITWGGNLRSETLYGEPWRLLTNVFVHIGIIHLFANMLALVYIGLLLEPRIGTNRFLIAYLFTGLFASLTSVAWHANSVSVGASGAIFGMYGVFLAMLTTKVIDPSVRKAFLTSISIFIGYNLINGLKSTVDNAAHIGGLVSGLLIGYGFYPGLKSPELRQKINAAVSGAASLLVLVSFFACRDMGPMRPEEEELDRPAQERMQERGEPETEITTNDEDSVYNWTAYKEDIKRFETMEVEALHIYTAGADMSDEDKLAEIKDRGIYYWNENLSVLKEAEALKLPPAMHERNQLMMQYCVLREKSYELMYKKYSEHTSRYDDEILNYEKRVAAIMEKIK